MGDTPVAIYCMGKGRHAVVDEAYYQGKFVPVKELSDEEPVIILAGEEGKGRNKGKFAISKDVKAGGVYDECGYFIGRDGNITFEQLEDMVQLLKITNFKCRKWVYVGGQHTIVPCLSTFAGNTFPISGYLNCGLAEWIKFMQAKELSDLEFEQVVPGGWATIYQYGDE